MNPVAEIDALALRIRPHYQRFLSPSDDRVLLTAHSHQAWPDVSREAQLQAWDDAARLVDRKWGHVFGEVLPRCRARIAARLGTRRAADLAIAPNTHELVYRLASCFPLASTVLTTDQEFHSLRRQLDRLAEDGTRVLRVPVSPEADPESASFADRFCRALDEHRPTWAALSAVFFTQARIVTRLPEILEVASRLDIPVLVDAYHAFNIIPLDVDRWPGQVFVTAGGYKYAEAGEGACFMLVPPTAERFRPRQTGWFADFGHLSAADQSVRYGAGGERFFGSTFDPTAFYRMLAVFDLFDREGLSLDVLRAQSQRQTELIIAGLESRGLIPRILRLASPRAPAERAGFVALETKDGSAWVSALEARGVFTDARGPLLRIGPAPYTTVAELERALSQIEDVAAEI